MTDEKKIARQLDNLVPGAPLVPDAGPGIVQEQHIGGPAWQDQKVIRDERRISRIAAVAGAKARELASRRIAAGSTAFADLRSDPGKPVVMMDGDGNEREYTTAISLDNPHADADRKLLEEEAARLAGGGQHSWTPREPGKKADVPTLATPEEITRRAAALGPIPNFVEVVLPEAYRLQWHEVMDLARERLANAGADLRLGSIRIFDNPNSIGQIAVWRKESDRAQADEAPPEGRSDA
jgi:hypothetical protein